MHFTKPAPATQSCGGGSLQIPEEIVVIRLGKSYNTGRLICKMCQ